MARAVRFRASDWFNPKTGKKQYGIQALEPGEGMWLHVCANQRAVLFASPEKRDARMAELRAEAKRKAAA